MCGGHHAQVLGHCQYGGLWVLLDMHPWGMWPCLAMSHLPGQSACIGMFCGDQLTRLVVVDIRISSCFGLSCNSKLVKSASCIGLQRQHIAGGCGLGDCMPMFVLRYKDIPSLVSLMGNNMCLACSGYWRWSSWLACPGITRAVSAGVQR